MVGVLRSGHVDMMLARRGAVLALAAALTALPLAGCSGQQGGDAGTNENSLTRMVEVEGMTVGVDPNWIEEREADEFGSIESGTVTFTEDSDDEGRDEVHISYSNGSAYADAEERMRSTQELFASLGNGFSYSLRGEDVRYGARVSRYDVVWTYSDERVPIEYTELIVEAPSMTYDISIYGDVDVSSFINGISF